jgi:carbonic anhydrase
VRAFVEEGAPLSPGDFIGRWMSMLAPVADAAGPRGALAPAEFQARLERASIVRSIDNLMTFPCIRILAERGRLDLHGAYFGVASGTLTVLDRASGEFRPIAGDVTMRG